MRPDFSFVFLTYNEEVHLERLLKSVADLESDIFILDSGSDDRTIEIAKAYNATIEYNKFETHPKQWDNALRIFEINTPWIVGLDADQYLGESLHCMLRNFRDSDLDKDINGIYFNRKNIFKGYQLRYGGYGSKYLLKMFRKNYGYSDLNELMDHRFNVTGKSIVWKTGWLYEENLKENQISFWLNKHNRYSDLVALDEYNKSINKQFKKARIFGSPNERILFMKNIWWRLPLFVRPFLYFFYRFFIRLGFMENSTGRIFHFLQAFWFRLVVDIKILELKQKNR